MDNYIALILKDVDAAIAKHNGLPTKERAEIILHLLDNIKDVTHPKYKKFLLNSEALLMCIKKANKMVRGNDEELIEIAVNEYDKSDFNIIQKLKQEIEPEVVSINYYLIIKRRHEKRYKK
jgi:hypothetical protein